MQVHPQVARLRGTPASQPLTDAALAAWRGSPCVVDALAALARFDAGERLGDVPALARLMAGPVIAQQFVAGFIDPLMTALRAEPLAHLPLGHSAAPGMARLRLAEHGRCGLTLAAFAQRVRAVSPSALFEDGTVHELVVAGSGRALLHRLDGGMITSAERVLLPGVQMARDDANSARQIIAVTRPLLVLQLTREAARPAPSREIALGDGRLVQAISGCKRSSQQMMALGVLGALAYRPAVAAMAQLAQDATAERDLRWEALRQALALDAVCGLALLAAIAAERADELAAPADALQRQLLAARPDLAALLPESVRCP